MHLPVRGGGRAVHRPHLSPPLHPLPLPPAPAPEEQLQGLTPPLPLSPTGYTGILKMKKISFQFHPSQKDVIGGLDCPIYIMTTTLILFVSPNLFTAY